MIVSLILRETNDWRKNVFLEKRLAQLSGIISVGVGDSVASIFGSKIGIRKWPGTKRTLEGSLAGLMAQFIFIACLWYLGIEYFLC